MTPYAALLRAVILGSHGKLAMRDIAQLCKKAGFAGAHTYITRGERGVFSDLDVRTVKATLEAACRRSRALMFLDAAPLRDAFDTVMAQVAWGVHEIRGISKAEWNACGFRSKPPGRGPRAILIW